MQLVRSKTGIFFAAVVAILSIVTSAWALDPGADGYYHTGGGIRVKTVAFVDFNVYQIDHYMKALPPSKSKQAVIDMDTDKKFVWVMKRDVDHDKITDALKDAFKMNGYTDSAKINSYIGAFSSDLKEKGTVTIKYDSTAKKTSVSVSGGGSATIDGADFMKAVWSIWFGKIDQPKLGDALIASIP
jgi:hypothetical protein